MATIKRFEDLEVWQRARTLNMSILPYLRILDESRYFGLKNQMDNSAGSIMDNIAEGFEREGNKEFIQFLSIAKGSLGETSSQLYRLYDRTLIDQGSFESLQKDGSELAGKLSSFIGYLKTSDKRGNKYNR
jgi:four helix bundle protein